MAENLKSLGDALDVALVGEGARFWSVLERTQRKLAPSATKPVMAGMVASLGVSTLWSVLARELTRTPLLFTPSIQSFAGAVVKEVGSVLSVLPFPMRVEAYQALCALLAEGLEIAVLPPEAPAGENAEEHC